MIWFFKLLVSSSELAIVQTARIFKYSFPLFSLSPSLLLRKYIYPHSWLRDRSLSHTVDQAWFFKNSRTAFMSLYIGEAGTHTPLTQCGIDSYDVEAGGKGNVLQSMTIACFAEISTSIPRFRRFCFFVFSVYCNDRGNLKCLQREERYVTITTAEIWLY